MQVLINFDKKEPIVLIRSLLFIVLYPEWIDKGLLHWISFAKT